MTTIRSTSPQNMLTPQLSSGICYKVISYFPSSYFIFPKFLFHISRVPISYFPSSYFIFPKFLFFILVSPMCSVVKLSAGNCPKLSKIVQNHPEIEIEFG